MDNIHEKCINVNKKCVTKTDDLAAHFPDFTLGVDLKQQLSQTAATLDKALMLSVHVL